MYKRSGLKMLGNPTVDMATLSFSMSGGHCNEGVNKQHVTYSALTTCIGIFNIFIISQQRFLLTESRKII